MLVFTRKRDEAFLIGDDIRVVIVEIRGDKVRLGVEAPKDVPVHRQEIYDRIVRKTKTTLVPLPVDIAEQVEGQAARAGITVEHYLSLLVGLGLAASEVKQCAT